MTQPEREYKGRREDSSTLEALLSHCKRNSSNAVTVSSHALESILLELSFYRALQRGRKSAAMIDHLSEMNARIISLSQQLASLKHKMCRSKKSFPTKSKADQACFLIDAEMRSYLCPCCGKWHLTSKTNTQK